jgi:hypothetical protein
MAAAAAAGETAIAARFPIYCCPGKKEREREEGREREKGSVCLLCCMDGLASRTSTAARLEFLERLDGGRQTGRERERERELLLRREEEPSCFAQGY